MAELQLHQFQISPFAAKVRRALHYKGLDFDPINYAAADMGRIRKTVSRSGKLPVLDHQGSLIVDSTNILRYLETTFPDKPLLPDSPAERSRIHFLEDWADESFFVYDLIMRSWSNNVDWLLRDVLSHDAGVMRWVFERVLPRVLRKNASAQGLGRKSPDEICADVEAHMDALVGLLSEGDWLVGDSISLADIAVASMCTVIERAEEADAMMQSRPLIMAWRERVDALTFPSGTAASARAIT
ncbi:MAG: glutathione S-transferase family protein [Pseudomonadota bacterium]